MSGKGVTWIAKRGLPVCAGKDSKADCAIGFEQCRKQVEEDETLVGFAWTPKVGCGYFKLANSGFHAHTLFRGDAPTEGEEGSEWHYIEERARTRLLFMPLPFPDRVAPMMRLAAMFAGRPGFECHVWLGGTVRAMVPEDVIVHEELSMSKAAQWQETYANWCAELTDKPDFLSSALQLLEGATDTNDADESFYGTFATDAVKIFRSITPDMVVADPEFSNTNALPAVCALHDFSIPLVEFACTGRPEVDKLQVPEQIPNGSVVDIQFDGIHRMIEANFELDEGAKLEKVAAWWPRIVPSSDFFFGNTVADHEVCVGPFLPDAANERGQQEELAVDATVSAGLRAWLLDTTCKEPIVYISFGTLVPLSAKMVERLVAGLEDGPWRVLWAMTAEQQQLLPTRLRGSAAKWRTETDESIQSSDVLRFAGVRAMVSDCGQLSTQEALSWGVPLVCMPMYCEQFLWAESVCEVCSAGVHLHKLVSSPSDVKEAVAKVLDDESYRENARACADRMLEEQWRASRLATYEWKKGECPGVVAAANLLLDVVKRRWQPRSAPSTEADAPQATEAATWIVKHALPVKEGDDLPVVSYSVTSVQQARRIAEANREVVGFAYLPERSLFLFKRRATGFHIYSEWRDDQRVAEDWEWHYIAERAKTRLLFIPLCMKGHAGPMMQLARWFTNREDIEVHCWIGDAWSRMIPKGAVVHSSNGMERIEHFETQCCSVFGDLMEYPDFIGTMREMFKKMFIERGEVLEEFILGAATVARRVMPDMMILDGGCGHGNLLGGLLAMRGHLPAACCSFPGIPDDDISSLQLTDGHVFAEFDKFADKLQTACRAHIAPIPKGAAFWWPDILPGCPAFVKDKLSGRQRLVGPFVPARKLCPATGSRQTWDLPADGTMDADLRAWMLAEGDPIIYIAFGTLVRLTETIVSAFVDGLAGFPCRVLWSMPKGQQELLVPEHLRTGAGSKTWRMETFVPQTTVLGFAGVRGFVSHCGQNSTQESLSVGVPMVCVPIYCDQFMWARAITKRLKAGVRLYKLELTPAAIKGAMTQLFDDSAPYLKNARACAEAMEAWANKERKAIGSEADNLPSDAIMGVHLSGRLLLEVLRGPKWRPVEMHSTQVQEAPISTKERASGLAAKIEDPILYWWSRAKYRGWLGRIIWGVILEVYLPCCICKKRR